MPGIHSMTLMWQVVAHGLTTPALDDEIYSAYLHTLNGSSTFSTGWGHRRANYELREILSNDGVLYDGEENQQTVRCALVSPARTSRAPLSLCPLTLIISPQLV